MEQYKFDDGSAINQGNQVVRDSVAPTPVADNPNIPIDQVQNTPALNLPTPNVEMGSADGMVAGVEAGNKSLDAYIKERETPESENEKKDKQLRSDLSVLYEGVSGKSSALAKEEEAQGANALKKQMAGLNAQIMTRMASYDKAVADQELAVGVPTSVVMGKQAAIRRSEASEIGLLQARALGLQGQLDTALDIAKRSVDLAYESKEDEIRVKEAQLELIRPLVEDDEAQQADALQAKLADEKAATEERKAKQKENISIVLESGIKTKLMNKNGEWSRTSDGKTYDTPEELFQDFPELKGDFGQAYAMGMVTDFSMDRIAEREFVAQIAAKYPDAGVTPGMTIDQATSLLGNSRIYREQTRPPQYASSGSTVASGAIVGADGKPIKLTAAQTEALAGFKTTMSLADSAIGLLNTGVETGPIAGRTLGLKKLTGGADPRQLQLEQMLGKLKADFMKAISGAAVSDQEVKRLESFLPSITDQEDVIKSKLETLKMEMQRTEANLLSTLGAVTNVQETITQPDGTEWQQNADGTFTQIK